MKVKLEQVNNTDKVSKKGNSYIWCEIKVNGEPKERGGFGSPTTKEWQKGDEVDIRLFEEEYQGKTYLKFEEIK